MSDFAGFIQSNTTPVPDILFDELLSELSESELKVLLYIIRRTSGFKKTTDAISLSQLQNGITTREGRQLDRGCGIKRRDSIVKALSSLEARGCITAKREMTAKHDHATTIYGICFKAKEVVTSGDQGSHQTELPVVTKPNHGSHRSAKEVVTSGDPQLNSNQQTDLQETVSQSVSNDASSGHEETSVSPTHEKQNDDIVSQEEASLPTEASVAPTNAPTIPTLEKVEPPQVVTPKETKPARTRTKKPAQGITLTSEERAVYDFYSHLWFVQVPPTINETTKTHCAALAPVVRSQEDMESLYKFTRDNCKFIKSKVIYLGNMVNCVNQWLQTQTKPVQASTPATVQASMDEVQAHTLAIKAVALASTEGHEIKAVAMLKGEKWVVVVDWQTKYFEKPETFESDSRYTGALKEMCQVWNSAKKKQKVS